MNTSDMANKLGYQITRKKVLAEAGNGTFYTRTDIHVTPINEPTKPPVVFRDKGSLELWLESKAQLQLAIEAQGGRPKKA